MTQIYECRSVSCVPRNVVAIHTAHLISNARSPDSPYPSHHSYAILFAPQLNFFRRHVYSEFWHHKHSCICVRFRVQPFLLLWLIRADLLGYLLYYSLHWTFRLHHHCIAALGRKTWAVHFSSIHGSSAKGSYVVDFICVSVVPAFLTIAHA